MDTMRLYTKIERFGFYDAEDADNDDWKLHWNGKMVYHGPQNIKTIVARYPETNMTLYDLMERTSKNDWVIFCHRRAIEYQRSILALGLYGTRRQTRST